MNLHEYQGKEILRAHGAAIQEGLVAETPEAAVDSARKLQEQTGTGWWVVKSQIHAGGRGKGVIRGTEQKGVALAKSLDEVKAIARNLLGHVLVTQQTGKPGKTVNKVLVAQDVYYPGNCQPKEYYMSVLLDRAAGRPVIVYSPEGGMNIEEVAEQTPHLIFREEIDPRVGLQPFQARKIAYNLGLGGDAVKEMTRFVKSLVSAYDASDASLLEINPLLKTSDNRIVAVDAKANIDDNALFRQPALQKMRDLSEEDPTEVEASSHHLNYVKLEGNVGCMVNGAGLAMATMDIIKLAGGEPANFLDVGGTANAARVEQAFRIILKDKHVKAILVNIFGGIVRCDRVAQGIVDAYRNIGRIPVPIIVRLQGTNADAARRIIDESGLKVFPATLLREAADLVTDVLSNKKVKA
jgi:succinyl-CoA synthetase beta subunit